MSPSGPSTKVSVMRRRIVPRWRELNGLTERCVNTTYFRLELELELELKLELDNACAVHSAQCTP